MEANSDQDTDPLIHPQELTPPGWSFQREHLRLMRFIIYVTQMASQIDEGVKIAAKALYDEEPDRYQEVVKRVEEQGATQALQKLHRTLVLEMMVCRNADNFLAYISELLALIFRTRPETLRSSETVRLDTILKHSTMEDLINYLADRRVNQLSYQGMRELSSYLGEHLGFTLLPKAEDLNRAILIVESRNLIVHNRGLVNRTFLSRVSDPPFPLGELLPLKTDHVFGDLKFLEKAVYGIDHRASDKFSLPLERQGAP